MAPQLATVDVALNAFYGYPMLSPTTRSLQKLKLRLLADSLIPEDKASQTISVSFILRQAPLLSNALKK